eukprot:TRINITY_DN5307_c0_g1_i1.p1 TRINITY_DN5307_c0_g1~~TRINITY_DN5307_c0_g1_i1.p1  ORF type:complete len:496 (+),score=82.46 TRINITY_DN5307_c0_g1_i1:100-1587(+)
MSTGSVAAIASMASRAAQVRAVTASARWRTCRVSPPIFGRSRCFADFAQQQQHQHQPSVGVASSAAQQGTAAGTPGNGALPPHLQKFVDEYEQRRAEEAGWLPESLKNRWAGFFGLGAAGFSAYVLYCIDDASSSVHTFTGWLLMSLSPESAQSVLLWAGRWGLLPSDYDKDDPYLVLEPFEGYRVSTPVGLGSGFDRDAMAPNGLIGLGFGFVEVGPVGFADRGEVIGRTLGDPTTVRYSLSKRDRSDPLVHVGKVGVSIVGNCKELLTLVRDLGPEVDYITMDIDVGPRFAALPLAEEALVAVEAHLRELVDEVATLPDGGPKLLLRLPCFEQAATFNAPVAAVAAARRAAAVKVAAVARRAGVQGFVIGGEVLATEITVCEPALSSPPRELVEEVYRETEGELMLIVRADVTNGLEVLRYIEAGAFAVQLPSPLSAGGPQSIRRIKDEVSKLLITEGHSSLLVAIGSAHRKRRKVRGAKNPWKKASGGVAQP